MSNVPQFTLSQTRTGSDQPLAMAAAHIDSSLRTDFHDLQLKAKGFRPSTFYSAALVMAAINLKVSNPRASDDITKAIVNASSRLKNYTADTEPAYQIHRYFEEMREQRNWQSLRAGLLEFDKLAPITADPSLGGRGGQAEATSLSQLVTEFANIPGAGAHFQPKPEVADWIGEHGKKLADFIIQAREKRGLGPESLAHLLVMTIYNTRFLQDAIDSDIKGSIADSRVGSQIVLIGEYTCGLSLLVTRELSKHLKPQERQDVAGHLKKFLDCHDNSRKLNRLIPKDYSTMAMAWHGIDYSLSRLVPAYSFLNMEMNLIPALTRLEEFKQHLIARDPLAKAPAGGAPFEGRYLLFYPGAVQGKDAFCLIDTIEGYSGVIISGGTSKTGTSLPFGSHLQFANQDSSLHMVSSDTWIVKSDGQLSRTRAERMLPEDRHFISEDTATTVQFIVSQAKRHLGIMSKSAPAIFLSREILGTLVIKVDDVEPQFMVSSAHLPLLSSVQLTNPREDRPFNIPASIEMRGNKKWQIFSLDQVLNAPSVAPKPSPKPAQSDPLDLAIQRHGSSDIRRVLATMGARFQLDDQLNISEVLLRIDRQDCPLPFEICKTALTTKPGLLALCEAIGNQEISRRLLGVLDNTNPGYFAVQQPLIYQTREFGDWLESLRHTNEFKPVHQVLAQMQRGYFSHLEGTSESGVLERKLDKAGGIRLYLHHGVNGTVLLSGGDKGGSVDKQAKHIQAAARIFAKIKAMPETGLI